MTKTTLICSPSLYISQEPLDEFEKHTRGISFRILREMGYDGQGTGKRRKCTLSPIATELRDKHECLCFDGRKEKAMNNKFTFVKVKGMG
jgi:hypothetical protein